MKIVQIISHYLPTIRFGGPLHVAHGLGRALVEAGHEVTVCTTNMLDSDSNMDVSPGEPIYIDGVRVIYEPVKLDQEYRSFDFESPWDGTKYIKTEVNKNKIKDN